MTLSTSNVLGIPLAQVWDSNQGSPQRPLDEQESRNLQHQGLGTREVLWTPLEEIRSIRQQDALRSMQSLGNRVLPLVESGLVSLQSSPNRRDDVLNFGGVMGSTGREGDQCFGVVGANSHSLGGVGEAIDPSFFVHGVGREPAFSLDTDCKSCEETVRIARETLKKSRESQQVFCDWNRVLEGKVLDLQHKVLMLESQSERDNKALKDLSSTVERLEGVIKLLTQHGQALETKT